jgi:hypothetical protein
MRLGAGLGGQNSRLLVRRYIRPEGVRLWNVFDRLKKYFGGLEPFCFIWPS